MLEAHSHGLSNRNALKTKLIFNSSLLFSKRKFSVKKSVLE